MFSRTFVRVGWYGPAMKRLPLNARAADALLRTKGEGLTSFIKRRREEGLSYFKIGQALLVATDGVIDVTPTTIKNWLDLMESE